VTSARPVRIAHAYGNRLDRLEQVLAADIDMIELDVWFDGGDVHVRHEHRVRYLPLLIDRLSPSMPDIGPWALRLPRGHFVRLNLRPLKLRDVLDAVSGRQGLLIDVKRSGSAQARDFARTIARQVNERNALAWTAVCGYWPVLDAMREAVPERDVRYTVSTPARLDAYLQRLGEGRATPAICAYHPLLDEPTLEMLLTRGVEVYAWTVDDAAVAASLVERGARGVISNDLGLLAGLRADDLRKPTEGR
jgi:glycerophosphoryl diester phosphodiesterase